MLSPSADAVVVSLLLFLDMGLSKTTTETGYRRSGVGFWPNEDGSQRCKSRIRAGLVLYLFL